MSIPERAVIPLPDDMPHATAVLAEPAATVLHALNISVPKMARPIQEQKAMVIGGGAIGLAHGPFAALPWGPPCGSGGNQPPATHLRRRAQRRGGPSTLWPSLRRHPPIIMWWTRLVARSPAPWPFTRSSPVACSCTWVSRTGPAKWTCCNITLAEQVVLGAYTYTYADLQATVEALRDKVFGNLDWVEYRALEDGPEAFRVLSQQQSQAAKIVLLP